MEHRLLTVAHWRTDGDGCHVGSLHMVHAFTTNKRAIDTILYLYMYVVSVVLEVQRVVQF